MNKENFNGQSGIPKYHCFLRQVTHFYKFGIITKMKTHIYVEFNFVLQLLCFFIGENWRKKIKTRIFVAFCQNYNIRTTSDNFGWKKFCSRTIFFLLQPCCKSTGSLGNWSPLSWITSPSVLVLLAPGDRGVRPCYEQDVPLLPHARTRLLGGGGGGGDGAVY